MACATNSATRDEIGVLTATPRGPVNGRRSRAVRVLGSACGGRCPDQIEPDRRWAPPRRRERAAQVAVHAASHDAGVAARR